MRCIKVHLNLGSRVVQLLNASLLPLFKIANAGVERRALSVWWSTLPSGYTLAYELNSCLTSAVLQSLCLELHTLSSSTVLIHICQFQSIIWGSDWFTRLTGRPAQLSGFDSSPCIPPPIISVHLFSWEIQLSETLFICFWTSRRHTKWKSGPLASPDRSGRVELAQGLSGLRYLLLNLMTWVQSQDLRSWKREPLPKVVLWSLYTCHATHTHVHKSVKPCRVSGSVSRKSEVARVVMCKLDCGTRGGSNSSKV